MRQSAGLLLYRLTERGLEVLLVHPSGWYNKRKPWSIPKGVPDPGEELEAAARRETWEETGIQVTSPVLALGHCVYKSGKRVHCFAAPAPDILPTCASWEIDDARYVSLDEARKLIHPHQEAFIERLAQHLDSLGAGSS